MTGVCFATNYSAFSKTSLAFSHVREDGIRILQIQNSGSGACHDLVAWRTNTETFDFAQPEPHVVSTPVLHAADQYLGAGGNTTIVVPVVGPDEFSGLYTVMWQDRSGRKAVHIRLEEDEETGLPSRAIRARTSFKSLDAAAAEDTATFRFRELAKAVSPRLKKMAGGPDLPIGVCESK